jgi:O-antigen/teichoic acid export membrane protein
MLAYFVDCTWLYVGVEDMKWAVIKNTLTKVFAVAGIFLFVHDEYDLPVYVFIQGASILVSNILAYSQLKKYVSKPHVDFSNLKNDLKGALLLFLPSVAATIYTQCDKVMIELLTGATNEVSFYDYSEKIVTIPLTFITVLSTVMMPRIANEFKKGNADDISVLLNRGAQFSMFLAFPMVFGLFSVSDKLVPWYLGDEFTPTIYSINLIAPIIILNSLSGVSGSQYFTATDQIDILIKSQFAAVVANVIINAILIPQYGFYGAAIATLITSFACAIIQYVYLLRQIKLPGLFVQMIKYFLLSMMMFIIIRFITGNMEATPWTNILQVTIGSAIYLCGCVILKDEQVFYVLRKVRDFGSNSQSLS